MPIPFFVRCLPLLCVALLAFPPTAQAGFEEGHAAYNKGNWREAITHLRPAAEQGDARALVLLGNMYNDGMGVIQAQGEAFALYYRAALLGNSDGMVAVGTFYQRGAGGVAQNIRYALGWYGRAAHLGNAAGAFFYGVHLFQGNKSETFDVKPDSKEALKWLSISVRLSPDTPFRTSVRKIADVVAKDMPEQDVKEARAAAEAFKPMDIKDLGPIPEAAEIEQKKNPQPQPPETP